MATAASALFYLWSRSLVNMVLGRLRRLRQPKYLVGGLLALAYMYFVFIYPNIAREAAREERAARAGEQALVTSPPDLTNFFPLMASLIMVLLFAAMWLWRRQRMSLQFSEAEIAYLFPGPVTHSALVHYSLIRTQAALLFSALFMTLVSAGWPFLSSPLWARFVGWWLITGVISLHTTASGFTLTRLQARGLAQWQRQVSVLALLVLAGWAIVALNPHLHLPQVNETTGPGFRTWLQGQVGEGALYWILLPFRSLAAILAAPDLREFLRALPAALCVFGLHYAWAFVSETPDPEGALARAEKRTAVVQAMRAGNWRMATMQPVKSRGDPFRLAAQGTPVIAFLWKNLLSTRAYLNLRTVLALAALMVGWRLWVDSDPDLRFIGVFPSIVALVFGAQTLLLGAQFARQDLRSDLDNADLIKTWPMAGWQIVLGEMLTPTLVLTGILWLCVFQIALTPITPPRAAWLTTEMRIVGGLAVALVVPFLCAVQLLVANTAVVLFPAWMKTGSGVQNQGIEVAGQRLLFFAGQVFVMLVAFVPALFFGVLVYIPASWFIGSVAMLPAAIVIALVLAGELAWGINWLGERFEAYDLSA